MQLLNNKWLSVYKKRPTAQLTLYCFSYAGGSASIFRNWAQFLPAEVEVVALQLPGRETRFTEPFVENFAELIAEATKAISDHMVQPAAFFGHSMGALLAYEVACQLHQQGQGTHLKKLFVSGAAPPCSRSDKSQLHNLPDAQFMEALRNLNGTPQEILQNHELASVFLPIIRADMKLIEQHPQGPLRPLPISIMAYGGFNDEITISQLQNWKLYTTADFEMHMFTGDHFFIHSAAQELMAHLNLRLQKILRICNPWNTAVQFRAAGS